MILLDGGTLDITSPNYPENYDNQRYCRWIVTASPGKQIRLIFRDFDTELNVDWLQIGDGRNPDDTNSVIMQYSGTQVPGSVVSDSNEIWITFTTDAENTYRGFYIEAMDNSIAGNYIYFVLGKYMDVIGKLFNNKK